MPPRASPDTPRGRRLPGGGAGYQDFRGISARKECACEPVVTVRCSGPHLKNDLPRSRYSSTVNRLYDLKSPCLLKTLGDGVFLLPSERLIGQPVSQEAPQGSSILRRLLECRTRCELSACCPLPLASGSGESNLSLKIASAKRLHSLSESGLTDRHRRPTGVADSVDCSNGEPVAGLSRAGRRK